MDQLGKQGGAQKRLSREPMYEVGKEGHYGACQQIANAGQAPNPDAYTGVWANINQGLHGTYRDVLTTYWQATLQRIEDEDHDYKVHQLPLARIKKVMKADPEVKMISAEAPILFAKGCDIFITELTMRAWIHAEENKRRTLQRSDISAALLKSDMFDFLIDIVPRDEANAGPSSSGAKRPNQQQQTQTVGPPGAMSHQPPQLPHQGMPPHPSQQQQHLQQQQHAGPHDYGHFGAQPIHHEQDGRYAPHPSHMYAAAQGAHPQPGDYGAGHQAHGPPPPPMYAMPGDPSQAMYGAYSMQPPHQMYQQQGQHQGQHPGPQQPPQLPAPQ